MLTVGNSGSAGFTWDGDPRASYLLIDDGEMTVVRVEYDTEAEARRLIEMGYPDAERLALVKTVLSMCTKPEQRNLVIRRARAIRTLDTLRFVLPFLDQPAFAQLACETIVELAHHREIRDPNKAEFDKALDKVLQTSKDHVVIDRAGRYKRGETWVRP